MVDEFVEAKKALLAHWETRRNELDALIGALRKELGLQSAEPTRQESAPSSSFSGAPVNVNELVVPGDFFGMTQVDAIQGFLQRTGKRPVTLQDIAAALYRGKATESLIEGEKALKNLSSLLSKTPVFYSVARGRWGLKEWYPKSVIEKKEAKKAGKANGSESKEQESDTSA